MRLAHVLYLIAHKDMLESGVLHRDVSLRNIMIHHDAEPGQRSVLLIDLDYAVGYPRLDAPKDGSPEANRNVSVSSSVPWFGSS